MVRYEDLPFTQQMQTQEVNVRGLYLSISCDIEVLLVDIIAKCEIANPAEREDFKVRKLAGLEMGKKLGRSVKSLTIYNPHLSAQFKTTFEMINDLLGLRNILAHSKISCDPNKKNKSILWFNYVERGVRIKETREIKPLINELHAYRNELVKLMDLVIILNRERGNEDQFR